MDYKSKEEIQEVNKENKNNDMANGTKPKQTKAWRQKKQRMSPRTVQKALKYVRREAEDQLLKNPVETQNCF